MGELANEPGIGRVSSVEVKARWAFSELLSPRAVRYYSQAGIGDLLELKKRNVAFSALPTGQVTRLAEIFNIGRPAFRAYLEEAPYFDLVDLTIAEVCNLRVLPQLGIGTVLNWAVSSRDGPNDARLQSDACLGEVGPLERIVVGKGGILIDGYFRTMRFLRRASPSDTLPAFRAP